MSPSSMFVYLWFPYCRFPANAGPLDMLRTQSTLDERPSISGILCVADVPRSRRGQRLVEVVVIKSGAYSADAWRSADEAEADSVTSDEKERRRKV
jgi:hypothetical protein